MSASWPKPVEGHLAEQHLGDRLSALVDGELGHDSRDRVLAHVATCPKCRAEVDAQRRLKNVFAEVAPPPPSESFLARLQGLPGGGDPDDGPPTPDAGFPGVFSRRSAGFGVKPGEPFAFDYAPVSPHAARPARHDDRDAGASDPGFRIHHVGRESERSTSRGMRFAFVAAGAVSLAAIALGGMTASVPADTVTDARGGSNITPASGRGTGSALAENQRRRAGAPMFAQGRRSFGDFPMALDSISAPLLPGLPAQPSARDRDALSALAPQVAAGAAAMSPLIRPFAPAPPVTDTAWYPGRVATGPGLLPTPADDPAYVSSLAAVTAASSRPTP
ncbi:zf-HC2 domain-containing protein [Streptomyces sp. NPDC008150]|uniref:anti-sigma factor family protein n=1 Tax=Streptomyces sp. NPDC008150 TaxID=3364816 RepID=UPI0036E4216F